MALGKILKDRRKELGLTLLGVAKKVGVSEATVQRWESGNIKNLRHERIVLLAEALEVSPAFLMGWSETEDSNTEQLSGVYFSLAKEMQEKDIDPRDVRHIIELLEGKEPRE